MTQPATPPESEPMPDIRPFTPDMAAACGTLFYNAVQIGAAAYYDQAQRDAWAGAPIPTDRFLTRFADQNVLTAWNDTQLTGFMTLRADGYLDMAFVAPEARGTGTADALLAGLLSHAQANGLSRLFTFASFPARSFFARHGWCVIRPNIVTIGNVTLENFEMEFRL